MENETNKFILINEKAELQPNLSQFLKRIDLFKAGKHYNIVSIIGSQSSGKSTLLNKLFGTKFDELNSGVKRQQTTKGIWVSKDENSPLMIMDVEGSDSKERWDERKEVGRFSGSQYGILKVIFEMNIKLFKHDSTKQLLFILRDYSDDDNYENITNLIKADIHKIWDEISKPTNMQNTKPEEMFKIEFFKLLHIKYCPDEFAEGIAHLKSQFTCPSDSHFFFNDFNYDRNLPIDSLQLYADEIWKTIKSQKDLNLPSQKVMVANLRCGQIKCEAFDQARPLLMELKKEIANEQKILINFGERGERILENTLKLYDEKTVDYNKEVTLEIRNDLEKTVLNELYPIFELQVRSIKNYVLVEFSRLLKQKESEMNLTNLNNFFNMVEGARAESVKCLQNLITKAVVRKNVWDINTVEEEIRHNIDSEKTNYAEKFQKQFISQKEKQYKADIEAAVDSLFNKFDIKILDNILELDQNLKSRANGDLITVLIEGFKHDESFARIQIEMLCEEIQKTLETEVGKKLVELNLYMSKKFKFDFLRNEHGVLRDWKSIPEPDIKCLCEKSKKATIEIFEILQNYRIGREANFLKSQEFKLYESTMLQETTLFLNDDQIKNILKKFSDETEEQLADALMKHNAKDKSWLPMWYILLLAVVGFNDFFKIMRSPLFLYLIFIMIIIFGFSFAIGYKNLPNVIFKTAYGHAQNKYGHTISRVSSRVMNNLK